MLSRLELMGTVQNIMLVANPNCIVATGQLPYALRLLISWVLVLLISLFVFHFGLCSYRLGLVLIRVFHIFYLPVDVRVVLWVVPVQVTVCYR